MHSKPRYDVVVESEEVCDGKREKERDDEGSWDARERERERERDRERERESGGGGGVFCRGEVRYMTRSQQHLSAEAFWMNTCSTDFPFLLLLILTLTPTLSRQTL